MKRTTIATTALVLAAAGARAQDLPRLDGQRPLDTRPILTSLPREKLDRIYNIRQLEVVFTNAVKAGASSLAYRLQVSEPNSLFVMNNAHSRGTALEDYGVFFYVDVPQMLQSVLWSVQMRQERLQDLYRARDMAADSKLPENIRRVAAYQARSLERILGIQTPPPPAVLADAQVAPPPPGSVVAATAENVVPAGGRVGAPGSPAPPAAAPLAPVVDPRNPDEIYTEVIKDKLIDAMLNYGSALRLDDKEWLVIAARSVSDAAPGQLDDSASVLLRIRGEDLNAYVAKRITRDEVIKKIEVKVG